MKSFFERLSELLKSRIFIVFCGISVLFLILVIRLFYLQILNGEKYQQELKTSIMNPVAIPASRGSIYDRYGRPLATNQVAFSVKIDDSINIDFSQSRNNILNIIAEQIFSQGLTLESTLPISNSENPEFLFNNDKKAEKEWKQSIGMEKSDLDMNASDTLKYLYEKYEIDNSYTEEQKRGIVSLAINSTDRNLMLINLINILKENGEEIYGDVPITTSEPYSFMFDDNEKKEESWKQSVGMSGEELKYSADETIDYLVEYFGIAKCLPESIKRDMVSLRYSLYLIRYKKYQPVTAAIEVSDKTIAVIEENQDTLPGVMIDTDSLRVYPDGEYFAHIVGYIRSMSAEEYDEYSQYKNPDGSNIYSLNDVIGKTGIEKVEELNLNGQDGEMLVEVDSVGRRINTIETKEPISGKDVFLTIDKNLQMTAFNALEKYLTEVQLVRLTTGSSKDSTVSSTELFITMVESNNISAKSILKSETGEQKVVKDIILSKNSQLSADNSEDVETAKTIIVNCIESGEISLRQLTLILFEQGVITGDEAYIDSVRAGNKSPLTVVIEKLKSSDLKPYETGLDPCTGSVVVSKVDSGEVLALVTYPSYDNNRLVNNFDNEYYNNLLQDPSTPLVNRPVSEKKAPGSTLKMVTALAGLETGVITPYSTITDTGAFTKAGWPYAKCWAYNSGVHGSINVSEALEVSCNYYFYETMYRMGNAQENTTLNSINTLNEYMAIFGLNTYTGIEIGETMPNMASAEYKERTVKSQNPDASSSQTRWTDGDSIRAGIGQSVNNFTSANMAKYIATLANGGTLYKMHIIDKISNPDRTLFEEVAEVIENIHEFDEENLEAVYEGMRLVTQGPKGTLRTAFKDFPIDVAAKSGTAQQSQLRSDHTLFVGFAPYENPQISIAVMVPFGDSSVSPAPAIAKEVIAEYMGLNYEPNNNYMENILAE